VSASNRSERPNTPPRLAMIMEKSMIALSMTVFLRAACRDECDLSMRGYEIDRDKMDPLHQQHSLRMLVSP